MKFCKDCKHYEGADWCGRNSSSTDVVTGKEYIRWRSATDQRRYSNIEGCGLEAKFFEGTWFYNIKIKLFGE